MKKKRSFFSSARYWNKLVHKFYNLNSKISKLIFSKNASNQEVNFLLSRLKKLYKKLSRLQVKAGVKIAGSALALMLATSSLNAQAYEQIGSFMPIVEVDLGSAPTFNDIDGDGNTDLFLGDGYGYIHHFEQNTDNEFVFDDTVRVGGTVLDVGDYAAPTFADIDNDGDLDLYIGNDAGNILYYSNDAGVFTDAGLVEADGASIVLENYTLPVFEDLDEDGDLDLYVGASDGYIHVFTNDAGVFSDAGLLQAGGSNINPDYYTAPAFGDIDGDGDLDLIVGYYYGHIMFYSNNGDGTFASGSLLQADGTDIQRGYYPFPTLKDLDNDGDVDLFLGSNYGDILIYENDGTGVFTEDKLLEQVFISRYSSPEFADIDGDSDLDIIIGVYDQILEYKNDGNGVFSFFKKFDTELLPNPTYHNDTLYVGSSDGKIQVYSNNGIGTFSFENNLQADGSDLDVGYFAAPTFADIDEDGDLDLFVGDYYGHVTYFINDANVYTSQGFIQVDGADLNVSYLADPSFADIDYDGDLDLIVGEYYGYLNFYENDGTGNFLPSKYFKDGNGDVIMDTYFVSPTFANINNDCGDLYVGSVTGEILKYHALPLPVVDTLEDVTAECSVADITPPFAKDACSTDVEGITDATFPITTQGTTVVTWTYTDSQGYVFTQTQNVIIEDLTPPDTPTLDDVVEQCDATITAPTTTDNCAGTITGITSDPLTYSDQGTYSVTWSFDDGNGNSIDVVQNVIIQDTEIPTFTCVNNQTVTAGDTHFYIVSGTEFDITDVLDNCEIDTVYNDFNNTQTLAGANLPEGTTTIKWYVYDVAGNVDSCSYDVLVNSYVGLNDFADLGISIFPNPTAGILNIQQINGYNVEIIDAKGVIVKKYSNVNDDNLQIDLSNQNKGMYILKIYNNEIIKNVKIIVK